MIPVYFHPDQASFRPKFEWALGKKIKHPETTRRVESIWHALEAEPDHFDLRKPDEIPLREILDVHSPQLLTLYKTARDLEDGHTFHPNVFPQQANAEVDPTNIHHAGFYCFDSGTPLNNKTWQAAFWSAASAYSAAQLVAGGDERVVYSMSRPPGHHATRTSFGGYCYFNNAAIAARLLRMKGRVAIIDIDFHHGNGTQSIFYADSRVLTISIHGDPSDYFPYFTGFPHETGRGLGEGFNTNIVLEKKTPIGPYLEALENQVLPLVRRFEPAYLIIAAGFDTYVDDPIGDFGLLTEDFAEVGGVLASLERPTVIVQEGGYDADHLGGNVVSMLKGFMGAASNG